jgi:hypothetical protein
MAIDYTNMGSILSGFNKILKLQSFNKSPNVPAPLVLVGIPNRNGLSANKIAARIISRKGEAGLPTTGTLPSGVIDPNDIMIRILVEEVIKAIQQEAKITVAISPGGIINGAGANSGGPVAVVGSVVNIMNGYGVIQ